MSNKTSDKNVADIEDDVKQVNTSLGFSIDLERTLNYLAEHNAYFAQIGKTKIRYIGEKEARKSETKEKTKVKKRVYAQNKRQKEKQEKQEYQKMLIQINRDNEYLSTKKKENDLQYAKWNRSIYEYDKYSSDLVLKDNINTGFNVAKRVSNVVNPNMIKSNKIYV